jgi:acetyl coenzyme A synthetase (ADP forming)-like protein
LNVLESLFRPSSIAVVGASRAPDKVGHAVLGNLKKFGFTGKIFPVNPKPDKILGLTVFPDITNIKSEVELAVVAIPAPLVPKTVRECVRKGVGTVVIISAGFKEAGAEGIRLEEDLKSIVRETGIRILGPNCLGVINTFGNLNATFAAGMLPRGRISFFSQSGALGIAILDWAIGNNIGFSKFISLGNKTDLNETDFIEYFVQDEETDIILGYLEDVVEGRRFLEAAKKATKHKPVILVKSGGTDAGARAASSHTGALAGSENAFTAAFRQTGIIRAEGVEDLFETARAFYPGKLPGGKNLLIVTNAGGPGIIAADTAEKYGIDLPSLPKDTTDILSELLPGNASLYNPVDIIGDAKAGRYADVLDNVLACPYVDGFLVILTPQMMTDVEDSAQAVISAAQRSEKPFIASFMGQKRVRTAVETLKNSYIPNYSYPEPAVRAFRKLYDYSRWIEKEDISPTAIDADPIAVAKKIARMKSRQIFRLSEDESREILSSYGFRFPVKLLAENPVEAADSASRIGFPVVMKISSPDILHKTDVGGVKIGVSSRKEAREAFTDLTVNAAKFMPSAFLKGVSIYETVSGGKEVILGITYDRTFGHMIMFGLGGIYVEVLKDVSFRIVPVAPADAREMVEEIKTYPLLKGARGEKPVNTEAIVESILRLSLLASDFPEIQELDINPLVVNDREATALDARIILSQNQEE